MKSRCGYVLQTQHDFLPSSPHYCFQTEMPFSGHKQGDWSAKHPSSVVLLPVHSHRSNIMPVSHRKCLAPAISFYFQGLALTPDPELFPAKESSLCSAFSYRGAENTIFWMILTCWTSVGGSSTFQAWDGIEALGQDKEESQSRSSDHLEISFFMCGTYGLVLDILCSDIKTKLFFKILPGVSSVSENNFLLMHAKYMWNALMSI